MVACSLTTTSDLLPFVSNDLLILKCPPLPSPHSLRPHWLCTNFAALLQSSPVHCSALQWRHWRRGQRRSARLDFLRGTTGQLHQPSFQTAGRVGNSSNLFFSRFQLHIPLNLIFLTNKLGWRHFKLTQFSSGSSLAFCTTHLKDSTLYY